MKFNIEASVLKEALESVQVKGKGQTANGFGNTSFGDYAYLVIRDNILEVWNGSPTACVKISIPLEGEIEEGSVCVYIPQILPYLKSFDDVSVAVNDFIALTSGNRKASVPLVVLHPNADALTRLQNMLNPIRYEVQPTTMFNFAKSKFEGVFVLTQPQLQDAIKSCELVKSGVYKFDYNNNVLKVSTRLDVTNKYEETITPAFPAGEPATVEFSSPVYSFFKKHQMLNVFMKDEFPLLIVADDRMLLKAPHISG